MLIRVKNWKCHLRETSFCKESSQCVNDGSFKVNFGSGTKLLVESSKHNCTNVT